MRKTRDKENNMKIKAKCIKRLFTDTLCVDKDESVYVEVMDCSWQDSDPFVRRCDDEDEYLLCRIPHTHWYKRYEVESRWIKVTLFGDSESAKKFKGLLFSDYFIEENIELTQENVTRIYVECVGRKENCDTQPFDGVMHIHNYDMNKVNEHKDQIKSMLWQLPDTFFKSKGGGWSFLNMCVRRDDYQWTGLHADVERLMTLGMAAGYVSYLLPKNLWHILPGDMPYIVINDEV